MDEGTEKRLLNVLHQNITKEQTLIVVTHKPRLLDLVDRIIILNAEGIVADGKKEVVLKQIQDATNKLNKS
jgi:ATP-binding cassette subfamily C protein LapB